MLNERKFRKIYDDYLASGLTVKDFCFNQGMHPGKFFYWQNKLKNQLPPKKGFVPILLKQGSTGGNFPGSPQNHFPPSLQATNESPICEINFPNGVNLKLRGSTDPEFIRSLIHLNDRDHV
jgi:hypothetical protein